MELFGFTIKKKDPIQDIRSVVTPSSDDGSTVVSSAAAYYGPVSYTHLTLPTNREV